MEDNPVRRKRSKTKKAKRLSQTMLARIKPNAAGIDCGSAHHHVAVPPDRDAESVRRFTTLTPDLYRLTDWPVESKPWRWRPPACTGSLSTTSSKSEAWRSFS